MIKALSLTAAASIAVLAANAETPAFADAKTMSFFVTSAGPGKGADLGGLKGADAHCQSLAKAAGSTKTWHAYLSTQGSGAVNARDRIGKGRGRTSRAKRSRRASRIFTATTTRSTSRPRFPKKAK
jgi:hypothetical protein